MALLSRRRIVIVACLGAAVLAAVWIRCGALPAGLLDAEAAGSTVIVDRQGEPLFEARSALGVRAESLDAASLPPALVAATLAAEDVRFRRHVGIDPLAIARAAYHDVRRRRLAEGGSTITEQVAKLLLARRSGGRMPRGSWAKIEEAVIALRLEHRLSKDAILALYLNLAPYGNQIQGAERAAHAYFGRTAATLTPAEAAFLAALPQQPGRFNPWTDASRATARQHRILQLMAGRGWISDAALHVAERERLDLQPDERTALAPHFVARVLATAGQAHPARIETTLDAELQRTIHGIIAAEKSQLVEHHASNVAVAVLDNHTGEWLAWEGSGDYFDNDHGGAIDGVISPRQPGSALKPFTYAAAFERGLTPGHMLMDVPSEFPTAVDGVLYSPRNYDGQFRGPLLARSALAGSENVPAVALASEIGVPTIARLLRRVGLTTLDDNAAHYGLGITLGNAEVRLDELVAAYAMFARGGISLTPTLIRSVDGMAPARPAGERLVSARTAFWITDILSDDEARAYIFGRGGSLEFPFPVAAKTGTSQSYFDNWAIGYTRDVTVGVWVGNFDRTPLRGSSGVTGAGPIFHAVMLAAVERVRGSLPIDDRDPIVPPSPDLHRVEICARSGMIATDACPTRVSEWLPDGAPADVCTWHHASDEGLVTVWPAGLRDWARANGLLEDDPGRSAADMAVVGAPLSPDTAVLQSAVAHSAQNARTALVITEPLAGAVFLIDPTLRREFQTLAFHARGASGEMLEWSVDGSPVGRANRDDAVRWPLARGRHQIVVHDEAGRSARIDIDVR